MGALLWSAFSALRAARRQARRSRIEIHYAQARRLVTEGHADPKTLRAELVAARDKALAELIDEQLDANEAFVILQDYLTAQIAEIDAVRAPGAGAPA